MIVGAAAGSTFARIFFKQVGLSQFSPTAESTENNESVSLASTAAVPPRSIASTMLSVYIERVHIWWPFTNLRYIRSCFQRIYQQSQECVDFEKFMFFIILALASGEARHSKESNSLLDINSSQEYFQTALHFFERFREQPRDLAGLQAVLLMTIWMVNSSSCNHSNDLWHMTRYAMSIALELGIHRHNPSWRFSPDELELRSRTWWAVYSLER